MGSLLLVAVALVGGYFGGIVKARRFYRPKVREAYDRGAETAVRRMAAL